MRASIALSLVLALTAAAPAAAAKKALFDDTHAETAGNADWQIDTDQPLPLPDQSTVTPATPRTYWLGAISSWGIDLVKRGYFVATLTTAYGVTCGDTANAYDLAKYDVFVVDEPNTRYTAAESTAIFKFVREGGGLVMVVDHWNSDRNGDGWDSPEIWNALDAQRLWGIHCSVSGDANNNITQNSGNVEAALDDSIIRGPVGVADSISFHNGATMTLYPGSNPGVKGEIWMNGLAHTSTTGVMVARSVYGNGRIVIVGDSSPADDGSATPGNSSIYDGWGEASGRDSLLLMNATLWATRRPATVDVRETATPRIAFARPWPNPGGDRVTLRFALPEAGRVALDLYDLAGRHVRALAAGTLEAGDHVATWDGRGDSGAHVAPGLYFARLSTPWGTLSQRVVRIP